MIESWIHQLVQMKKRVVKRMVSMLLVFSMLFTMLPASATAGSSIDNSAKVENPFTDISKSDWCYESVLYALSNGLFSGISAERFDPQGTMTRAMYVTVMGRMAEIDPKSYGGNAGFQDVDSGAWYGPYVAWAKEQGITGGVGGGKFDPTGLITREQMAAMTVRFFDAYQIEYPPSTVSTTPVDAASISAYAQSAVMKLWGCGLLQGDSAGNFNPQTNASRAEAATVSERADHIVEQWLIQTGQKKDPKKKVTYTYYQLTFDSNGGSKVEPLSRPQGAVLNQLPTPYLENNIFHGWCYDSELTRLVSSSDTLLKNTTLYAKWGETAPLPEDETPVYARAIDTGTDFVIRITAPTDRTAEQVQAAITMQNVSSNEDKEWIAVTEADDVFVVSGVNYGGEKGAQQPGFIAGANYKLTLNDDALAFEGQNVSARTYDFTIKKGEVMNVSLNEDIRYIHTDALSDLVVNGAPATEISIAVITVGQDGSTTQNGAQTVGSFTYTKEVLTVGDSVAIYKGESIPTMESSEAGDEAAFVTITAAEGSSYSYQGAAMDEVLFMPDVLPVAEGADTDGNRRNASITVPVEVMTYTDDKYANLGLTSQTTVDAGDFISFYTGDLTRNAAGAAQSKYAKIDTVAEREGDYIITYTEVTQEQMMEAMSAYRKEQLEGEELLEGVDTEAVERSVEQQARDSGFADEAGMYLAAMALETDSFTEISDDFDLSGYSVTMPEGVSRGEIAMARGEKAKVEVDVTTLQATISTDLVHFENLSGLRLTLTVGVEVTIHAAKGDIVITVTGSFEQEVKIDLGVDGCAVWKWWFIFPYIAEYKVTAWVDLYSFTGIGIQATIVTKEADDGEGMGTGDETFEDIGQQIKDLLDEKDKYIGDGEGTVASTLEEKYAAMLENESDWVELFSKDIFTQHFRIILIIDIEIKISFVVTANMNISLGLDFWYENAKRYLYSVEIFSGKVTNETIDLVEEHYEFEFYVMGTMGLRAGVKASIAVGLFSTKLASVGFGAEAGVYVRVWGYFYYQLIYRANSRPQKTTHYAGALLFELGIYLEITFLAQAFNGTFSYNPTLYENEWPMWSAGMQESIQDFAYEPEDSPTLNLKKAIQTTVTPDALFEMAYLDLKTGDDETKIFDDSTKYFTIAMTNPQFSYDRESNRLTVTPGEKDFNLDGEMILTWVNQPLAFSSAAIQRRIPLHWDSLSDGYAIVFHTNGGSSIPIIIGRYNAPIKAPQDPVKRGYDFAGWYSDEALTQSYVFPETMPNVDVECYAKWTPSTDTPYRVEHYGAALGSSQYTLLETESLQGTTDSTVAAQPKIYPGYTTPEARTLTIAPDGSGVLRYYYDLTAYTLTFDPGVAQGEQSVTTLKYGAVITPPVFSSKGYTFTGWDTVVASNMPAQDLTYEAQWQAGSDTPYRVEYYVEQPDGRFALQRLAEKTGETGGVVVVATLLDPQYLVPGGISERDVTVGGEATTQPTITEDGKLIIKVNYKRITHTVTYEFANAVPEQVDTYRYEARITPPANPTRPGYTFTGWDAVIPDVMGTEDLHFTAQWSANTDTAYKVEHYQQNANDDGYTLFETENLTGTTDTTATAADKNYENFTLKETASGDITGDGALVLKHYYDRDMFTVDYTVEEERPYWEPQTYKHGQEVTDPADPTREGYSFLGWTLDGADFDGVMPAEDITLSAKWGALTDYAYTVNYYKEGLKDGADIFVKKESPIGEFGSEVTVTPTDDYDGFTTPEAQTVTIIKGLTVDLIYTRNTYELSWMLADGTVTNESAYTKAGEVEFETPIVAPALTKTGYTYLWDQPVAAKMGTEPLTYTALWTPNTYTVKLAANGGVGAAMADMMFTYDAAQALTTGSYTRSGYTFAGWATTADATSAAYADGESVRNLTPTKDGVVTLYAVWEAISYPIDYTLDGGTNSGENPSEYTVEESITLREPTKPGYTFGGWYTDAGFTGAVSGIAIGEGSTGDKHFYAKWTANAYTVMFHKNIGTADTTTQSFTYDVAQALTGNSFSRGGYTFGGWNTAADGTGTGYTNGQSVENLATGGTFNLYAQWTAIPYTITYTLGGGNDDHANPTSYTVESDDIALKSPTRANGYSFMGWYNSANQPVTAITKGSTGDKPLTAKWGFAGSFTVQNNGSSTFTITRNGNGTDDTQNVGQQTVYFRTVNGTAIGGTHFDHTGGSSAVVTFLDGETSKTVAITEKGVATPYTTPGQLTPHEATAYSNIDRSYGLELVKVNGGGLLGDTTKATRTMAKDASKVIDAQFYVAHTFDGGGPQLRIDKAYVTGSNNVYWDKDKSHRFLFESYHFGGASLKASAGYFSATVSSGDTAVSAEVTALFDEEYPCEAHFRMTELDSFDSSKASKKSEIPDQGTATFGLGPVQYALTSNGISIYYGLWGAAANVYLVSQDQYTLKVNDTREPLQIGVAPMAEGNYKAGETVTISVVFDEIVANATDVTISGTNLTGSWACTGGTGSNVLTFTGTLANDCDEEALVNNVTLTGTVSDMAG